jgi:peptidoglycan/xylan/chitin deacetylase (PgdA/CDA1 family)
LRKNTYKLIAVCITFMFLAMLTACSEVNTTIDHIKSAETEKEKPVVIVDKPKETEEEPEPARELDLEKVKPNEAGKVMIIMYHDVSENEATWSRNYENFRKDLELFYNEGYRLISLTDFINNNINVQAGFTPLVITFDDGHRGQFNLIEEEGKLEIDPKSAVGIMNSFAELYPDFGKSATFYIYYPVPFRQKEHISWKLEYLVKNGMEIGNHTDTHANLASISRDEIIKQLALNVKKTREFLPGYNVNSLALPNGGVPIQNLDAATVGDYEGVSYKNEAILLVGANPAYSPVDKRFNPLKLPRVRGSSEYIDQWIEYFKKHPEQKYISDGQADVVTVPEEYKDIINMETLNGNKLRLY